MKAIGHLRIEEVKLSPGEEWTRQTGPWCFVRISNGAAYWLDPARPRALNQGELIILAPAVKAVIRASQLGEVILQGFNFAPDLLYGFFTVAERHCFESPPTSPLELVRFLPSTHPINQHFADLAAHREAGQELAERAAVLGLALAFLSEGLASGLPAATRNSPQGRFTQIVVEMPDIELIHKTPEQLARLCGCSARHFNRLFREQFGQSPRSRQTDLRLLKARQLLSETDEKIARIALDSGYRSLSLFNALFKRRFGVSPSEWRQQAAQDDRISGQFRPSDTDTGELKTGK
jgi:AraC-like DNA-binding protein